MVVSCIAGKQAAIKPQDKLKPESAGADRVLLWLPGKDGQD